VEKTMRQKIAYPLKNISRQDLDSIAFVAKYIDGHFGFEIPLDQLARIACMGTTKLKYTFKDTYKCTITEYIQNKRMSHAEQLLMDTDLNIYKISQVVGYKNASRFSELFRKKNGLLPSEYRKLSTAKH
jgi:AraC-like DNA-binding protein